MNLKIDFENLLNTHEFCYFLGLSYADGGYTKNDYSFAITTTENDLAYFVNIFNKFYDFKPHCRKRQDKHPTWKNAYSFYICNKQFCDFMRELGFDDKIKNATKILNHIKDPLCRQLFFTGYFDGDGCVYYNQKQYLKQLAISAPINQDWTFILNLCKELNIQNYNIFTTKTKKGYQSSQFRICNKKEFEIFLSYIYGVNDYGFQRKKDKFIQAMNTYSKNTKYIHELRSIKNNTHHES